ncbi:hypothetical protein C2S52_002340 [Perilla frutescens var. hirtella]|nr:hypothetical protein C2S52_002340 [Perilla frutescens var. hirtella]
MDDEESVFSILIGREGCDDEYSSIFEFKHNLQQSCLEEEVEEFSCGCVFYDHQYPNSTTNNTSKIITLLKHTASDSSFGCNYLLQFWSLVQVKRQHHHHHYLSTSDQPFCVSHLRKGLCWYRKLSTGHVYDVDEGAEDEQLGGVGRAYRSKNPESTPDLRLYSIHEFPLRNHAARCGLRVYLTMPLFGLHNNQCYGVLEFLSADATITRSLLSSLDQGLQIAGLKTTHTNYIPISNDNIEKMSSCRIEALTEIREAFMLITEIPQLYAANVWIPYGKCASITTNTRCMELVLFTEDVTRFMSTNQVHVQLRKGIIGMVLASESKSCFCRNLCEFSIADQPLAHYERRERLDVCFAICLQSSHTGDLLYVLEFYLYPTPTTDGYLASFLNFLLPAMKQELKTFKIASGKQLGEELVVEVIGFSRATGVTSSSESGQPQPNVFPFKFKSVQYSEDQPGKSVSHTSQTEQCSTAAAAFDSSKITETGKRKSGLHLSLEVLKPHFGKKLKDVAEELCVGRSTIKRACRDYGIERWPFKEKHARNLSLVERESARDSLQDMWPSRGNNLGQTEAEKVMIKVRYEEDIIRFELCVSSGVQKLREEVAMRLHLEMSSLKLKYFDEDNDEILLACDADLQLCPKSGTKIGKTCIQLFAQLISQ